MIFRKIAATVARPVAWLLHATGLMRPEIIVRMQDGLAAQIHFYLVSRELLKNGPVAFDLVWYDEDGKDIDGIHARNFDLLKLSPGLDFPIARNPLKLKLYRLLYTHLHDWNAPASSWRGIKAPAYLTGFYGADEGFYSNMREQIPIAPADLTPQDKLWLQRIQCSENAVGVHVRRGDLTREVESYGKPATVQYFVKAVKKMQKLHGKDIPFLFFSDEPQWVIDELIPQLPQAPQVPMGSQIAHSGNNAPLTEIDKGKEEKPERYQVVAQNGSDRGYIDLYLLTQCRHFITSKGSYGKFAALMSPRRGTVILNTDFPDNTGADPWFGHIPDAITL